VGKLIVTEMVTVDGVAAAPSGPDERFAPGHLREVLPPRKNEVCRSTRSAPVRERRDNGYPVAPPAVA
jgi:hypothetical protein